MWWDKVKEYSRSNSYGEKIIVSNDEKDYPIRGQYGKPEQRCMWCGKPIVGFWSRSKYCSSQCSSAGDYPCAVAWGVCCTGLGIILVATFAFLIFLSEPPEPGSFWLRVSQSSFQLLILMIISFIMGLFFIRGARRGHKMRKASRTRVEIQDDKIENNQTDSDEFEFG